MFRLLAVSFFLVSSVHAEVLDRESIFGDRVREAMGTEKAAKPWRPSRQVEEEPKSKEPGPTPEELKRYKDLGWNSGNTPGDHEVLMQDSKGETLVTMSYSPWNGRDIIIIYGKDDYRWVTDAELGYFANGGSEALRKELELSKKDGSDPLAKIYKTTRDFLSWFKAYEGRSNGVDFQYRPAYVFTAESNPALAKYVMYLKTVLPKYEAWQQAEWHRPPTKIYKVAMERVVVTYEQNESFRGQFGLPFYTSTKKLGKGTLYILGREQLKNYGVNSQKILESSHYRKDFLTRADGQKYLTGTVDVWAPIEVEQVYPPEEK